MFLGSSSVISSSQNVWNSPPFFYCSAKTTQQGFPVTFPFLTFILCYWRHFIGYRKHFPNLFNSSGLGKISREFEPFRNGAIFWMKNKITDITSYSFKMFLRLWPLILHNANVDEDVCRYSANAHDAIFTLEYHQKKERQRARWLSC